MSGPWKILITCDLGTAALDRFAAHPDFAVHVEKIADEAHLVRAVPGFHAVIVRSNVEVTAAVMAAAPQLKVIGRAGIGVDNIDVAAASEQGIAVVNAPGGNVVTTAEHAVAMMMSLARKIPQASASMKAGRWDKKRYVGRELRNKTLGIVGVGRVGSVVAGLAHGLGMKVVAYDPFLPADRAEQLGIDPVDLATLLAHADVLTVHTPLTEDTRGILGTAAFARVKPGVLLVNCARGGVVDEAALLRAIEDGQVAGAALDVFEVEPPPPTPLYARDEVILTPHLGASTVEAQESVAVEVSDSVVAFLTTGVAANALNVPRVPAEVLRRLQPFLDLAERLGLFLAQIAPGPVTGVEVLCRGNALEGGSEVVTASFLQGLLRPALSTRVNLVNAIPVAKGRGVQIKSSTSSDAKDFTELISVSAQGSWGRHELEGTLFGMGEARLVRFDVYRLDARPRGNLVLLYNDDVPGVIGSIGTCLGRHNVNIAGMYNGRDAAGGRAINLVNTDEPAGPAVLDDLRTLPHIQTVQQIQLP